VLTDDTIIDEILAREGGYVDNPADRGGPTKFGIRLATLAAWRDAQVTAEDVEQLSQAEARLILRRWYLIGPGFGRIQSPVLRGVLVDCCVLHGEGNAVRMLQRAMGVRADALLGPLTEERANAVDGRRLALLVEIDRLKFIGRIVTHNLTDADKDGIPDNTEMASGWVNRVAGQMEGLV
jgi:lysozyme family protein